MRDTEAKMDRALLVRVGTALFGEQWISPLAKLVGMRTRSMERMASGDADVPDMRATLAEHCEARANELLDLARKLRG